MNLTSSVIKGFLILGSPEASHDFLIKDNIKTENNICLENISSFQKNKYAELLNELFTYKDLKDNWDGYDGIRPSDEIISTVQSFLNILKVNRIKYPKMMVAGSGEIALFWKTQDNYIEIDFDTINKLSFFYELGTKLYGEDDVILNNSIPKNLDSALSNLFIETSSTVNNVLIDNHMTFNKPLTA